GRMFALGVLNVLTNSYVLHALCAVLLVLLGARSALWIVRHNRLRDGATPPGPGPGYDRELAVLFTLAATFTVANLPLLVPVAVPLARWTDAAGVFGPRVAAVGVFARGGSIRALWSAPAAGGAEPGKA